MLYTLSFRCEVAKESTLCAIMSGFNMLKKVKPKQEVEQSRKVTILDLYINKLASLQVV